MRNVRSKNMPQLIRKRTIIPIPKNIVVVVEPSKRNVKNLQEIANTRSLKDLSQAGSPPVALPRAAVSAKIKGNIGPKTTKHTGVQNNKSKLKRTKVTYQTRDPSPESAAKIYNIKNVGLNRTLLIIGNGPSINEIDLSAVKSKPNIHTLSINKPDPRLWPTDYWAFFDTSQLRRHQQLWDDYNGILFNSTAIKKHKPKSMQFKNIGGKGFSLDASRGINIGRSSVYAAMQIALWMNYQEIFIFGCDMNPNGINGRLHFYGENPDVNPSVRKNRFKNEADYYEWAAENLDETARRRFYFCSEYNPWSFVASFNSLSHHLALSHILSKFT